MRRTAAAGPRDAALAALLEIERAGLSAKDALEAELRRQTLGEADRALATALTYGVARERRALDEVLRRHSRRAPERLDPTVRAILRLALYQLRSLDRIPPHAAVYEAVEQARRHAPPGAERFVNAVLRSVLREAGSPAAAGAEAGSGTGPGPGAGTAAASGRLADEARRLASAHSFPVWIVERWLPRYGPAATEAMLAALNRPPDVTLRVNRLRATVDEVRESLEREGVAVEPARLFPEHALRVRRTRGLARLEAFRRGWVQAQDESSMVAAAALGAQPGELVLDVAAAPGGKACQLAEWMGDSGRVVANDADPHRAALIRENAGRLGLTSVEVLCGDARALPERFAGAADRVLADVPCTGLGVLHRRPEARWRKRPSDPAQLSRLQLELARAAADCLRPGGVMVYSTCTTEPEENEEVVARLLAERPDLALDDLRPHLPPALRGEPSAARGWLLLLPHRHGVDGFFVARLVRRG
ncbi:MAG: 16S rRNA (cytosine(967)-C(5))-methyltransferase RsmB [Firmicutes bacterium]|nr:16S rRNA (cytosine(967)-C(5))-methyltransferase RsmB [Bacillota bacterium]